MMQDHGIGEILLVSILFCSPLILAGLMSIMRPMIGVGTVLGVMGAGIAWRVWWKTETIPDDDPPLTGTAHSSIAGSDARSLSGTSTNDPDASTTRAREPATTPSARSATPNEGDSVTNPQPRPGETDDSGVGEVADSAADAAVDDNRERETSVVTNPSVSEQELFTGEETIGALPDHLETAQQRHAAGDHEAARDHIAQATELIQQAAIDSDEQKPKQTLRGAVLSKLETAQNAVEGSMDVESALADAAAAVELFKAHRQAQQAIATARQAREGERLDQLLRSLTVLEEARREVGAVDTAECPIEDATNRVSELQTSLNRETVLTETARDRAQQ